MRRTTPRLNRSFVGPALLMMVLAFAGCSSRGAAEETVLREPVSSTGANPFTAAMGVDQQNVTPPPGSGGSFPGDTVGLFGGTENEATCDKAQLVTFLQQDRAKAAAWAGVVGITIDEIPSFIAALTPAVLRSDTRVINHGFVDGKATEIPAVFQAGTAVLVDVHGTPVTKCFCGNPLKVPPAVTSVTFSGPQWTNFSETDITVIVPVTQTVQQFVFVEPTSGHSFQRPAGTAGRQDAPATAPVPTTFPPPTSPVTPPATSGTTTQGSPAPPGIVPTATPSISPSGTPSPTGSPGASPTTTPTPSPSATTSPSPTPSAVVKASWVVGDCFVQAGRAHATVLVRVDGPTPHTFTVRAQLGDPARPIAVETIQVPVQPGQVGRADVEAATNTPDGRVQCAILSIVDENGATPVAGDPLPPPPDSAPMPGQPTPGQTSGPLPTPPAQSVPAPTPS